MCVGQFSGDGAFVPLVVMRLVQSLLLVAAIVRAPAAVADEHATCCRSSSSSACSTWSATPRSSSPRRPAQLAIAAVLSSLYPVATVILAITILRERVTRSHLVGIALTALAIVLIGVGSATL